MARRLQRGLRSVLKTAGPALQARSFSQSITDSQIRRTLDRIEIMCRCQSCRWFPFHHRRSGLDGIAKAAGHPYEYSNLVPAPLSPRAFQWEGTIPGRETFREVTLLSNTPYITPRSHQWEGAIPGRKFPFEVESSRIIASLKFRSHQWEEPQDSEGCLRGEVFQTADVSLTPGEMPRSGYDTTHMRMAQKPRPAGSAVTGGSSKNKNRGNGSGDNSKEDSNGHEDDKDSEATAEQQPGQGSKDGKPTTEEIIKSIDNVRLPLEGRGWTFWL